MEITPHKIKIREIAEGYVDNAEEGARGYGGKLDIRPQYQREFVYNDEKREAVIQTIRKGFPLNVMYWVDRGDGTFEVLDGQQRTISFCQYVNGDFSVDYDGNPKGFKTNLTNEEKNRLLDYEVMIYFCKGGDNDEKLAWFDIINIAGEKLTEQERRNAVYSGPWLSDAKAKFSKPNAPAKGKGEHYVKGSPIRQEYLEVALDWISDGKIKEYMAKNQKKPNANELWEYFQSVINWAEDTFPERSPVMKGVNWGKIYRKNKNRVLDKDEIAKKVRELFSNEEIDNKKYVYEFVLIENPEIGDDRKLSKRVFSESDKHTKYAQQKGICPICKQRFDFSEMHADHIKPWSKGGRTILDNCQMLCTECNLRKAAQTL